MDTKRFLHSEGIILFRYNYGEGDRIIRIFSSTRGKIVVLAKGIRKLPSKKRGSMEVFSRIKFSVYKNSGMAIITEAQLLDPYSDLRKSVKKVALAYYVLEVIDKLTQEDEYNLEVYELLKKTLSDIEANTNLKTIKDWFSTEILVILGFWPRDKTLTKPDNLIQSVLNKKLNTLRVGRQLM